MIEHFVTNRRGQHLYSVTLTTGAAVSVSEMIELAAKMAQPNPWAPDDGLWLVLDVSRRGRPHLHGLALTADHGSDVVTRWLALSGAGDEAQAARWMTGQDLRDGPPYAKLADNLGRAVRYHLKPFEAAGMSTPPYEQRVVSSGVLEGLWRSSYAGAKAAAPLLRAGRPQDQTPRDRAKKALTAPSEEPSRGPAWRRCGYCLRGMQWADYRGHAKVCSAACRTRLSRFRRDLERQLDQRERAVWKGWSAVFERMGSDALDAADWAFDEIMAARRWRDDLASGVL